MKRAISAFILIFSFGCSLIPTADSIAGVYTYTATFISQELFRDTLNTSLGDTSVTSGVVVMNWQTVNSIVGDGILVEKSVGDSLSFEPWDTLSVNQSGSHIDSVFSGNDYFYRFSLLDGSKKARMHSYVIDIPVLLIHSPSILSGLTSPDSFNIVFSSIENNMKYAVKITNASGDSIWGRKDIEDTVVVCEGLSLPNGVYAISVTTWIPDILTSQSIVTTTGISQFTVLQ